jgi:hypothetical protein
VLGAPASVEAVPSSTGAPTGIELMVAKSINSGAFRLPYRPNCLERAAAAQIMLRRRGRAGTVVIGLAPGQGWGAHAWLVGDTGVVVGEDEARAYFPASVFR